MIFDLSRYFDECRSLVDASLETLFSGKNFQPPRLYEAMRYSLFAGGKRIRPILCIAASEACGGGRREVLPVACALEMIHTFSLVHDDLPAMDDDDLRRGRPTNHKVYGDAMAILAGDALMIEAFVLLGKMKESYRDPRRVLDVITDIADATGAKGMVGGQVLDLEGEGSKPSLDGVRELHRLKTGRLISVSVTSGGKMVTQDDFLLSGLTVYGDAVGLAFQIIDDILDVEGGEEWGKKKGSDARRGKATYPAVMEIDAARKEAATAVEEAISALVRFGPEADPLREIARFIVERKK